MFGNAIGLSPGNLGMKLFKPSAAAPLLWWDPNNEGLPVVGAYRAIATVGSPWPLAPANYAESLQNWANLGTYDLTEIGGGPVNWAANVGWSGFLALARCLNTNIIPTLDQTWTALVECADAGHNDRYVFGVVDSVGDNGVFQCLDRAAVVRVDHGIAGTSASNAPALGAVVNYGFAGRQPYRDGAPEAIMCPVGAGTCDIPICLGGRNWNGLFGGSQFAGSISSFVIYSGTLTGVQVAAVDAAMGQL